MKIEDNVAVYDLSPDRRDGPEKNVNIMFQRISKISTLVILCSLSMTSKDQDEDDIHQIIIRDVTLPLLTSWSDLIHLSPPSQLTSSHTPTFFHDPGQGSLLFWFRVA